MIKRDPTGFRQMQLAAAPFEQCMAQPIFQFTDLNRQGRLRQVQPSRSPGQVSIMGDGPEVLQVIVIEVRHIVLFRETISHTQ